MLETLLVFVKERSAGPGLLRRLHPRLCRDLRRQKAASGLALLAALGCTEFKPGSDLESTTSMLQPTASVVGTPWACLESPVASVPARSAVSYAVTIVDSVTNQPPSGLTVKACDDLDIMCARPVAPPAGVSADGRVRLSLAQGFDGFFEITSDSTVPTLLYPDGILRNDQDGILLELIDEQTASLLALAAGVEVRDGTGIVLARAFDCDGVLSSGVEFQNDTGGQAFAFIDGLPIEGPTTGGEGLVMFINVPPGFTFIEGVVAGNDRPMGSTTAESRPGYIVYADVRPPP